MGLSHFDQALWFASAALAAVIIGRIVYQGLFVPPFRAFGFMLGVVLARDIVLSISHYDSHAYIFIWKASLPILLAAQAWCGLETLRAVQRLYPQIGRFAISLFLTCLGITVAACCLGLPFELHRVAGQEALLRALFLLQRWVDSWIAGTLILVALFFARSPAPQRKPPRNLVLHTILLSLYFGGYGAMFFAENLAALGGVEIVERLQFSFVVLLYVIWATCLSAKGQQSEPWPKLNVILVETFGRNRNALAARAR